MGNGQTSDDAVGNGRCNAAAGLRLAPKTHVDLLVRLPANDPGVP